MKDGIKYFIFQCTDEKATKRLHISIYSIHEKFFCPFEKRIV